MNRNLNIKIAYWYYELGMTQDEIAKRLSFTRQKVNQIINSLVDLDIVTINIHGYERDNIELETKIEEKFGLKEVIAVSDYGEKETVVRKVANVAAQYLDEIIQRGDIIGVAWGQTLSAVVEQMQFKRRQDCRVIQLIGAQNIDQLVEEADEIARGVANRLDCPSHMLYAPVVVEHAETKNWLMKEKSIKASFEMMKKCTVALLGVGALTEDSTMCTRGHLTKEDIHVLKDQGFIADISMNPIRADGSADNCPLSDRLLNADLEVLREIDNAIVIACGEKKADAILAALRTGCVDTLIVDETTARLIIERM